MRVIRNVPWPRVVAESAIIVASILLAFWLEAWWSDRKSAEEERAILERLQAEIGQVIRESASMHTMAQAIYESTTTLANYSVQGDAPKQDDETHRLFADFTFQVDPNFTVTPVLESLFYTGDLDLISNGGLRRDISEVRIQLGWLRAEVERESKYFNETVMPYLQQNGDIAQFYTNETYSPGHWGNPEYVYFYPGLKSSPVKSQIDLLERRDFQNVLLHRLTTLGNALWRWQVSKIDEKLKRIETQIDQELENL